MYMMRSAAECTWALPCQRLKASSSCQIRNIYKLYEWYQALRSTGTRPFRPIGLCPSSGMRLECLVAADIS
ncbi:hypothetical protein HBI56_021080 [Parastagonospora nodorum]|uniref:Uncharacterized protein n=1 Tax=Phaeosphaeria nodorum (strain SN15 / ATCC MYA-4574 / FGSC 10173) TaxID=321614 RepID=A0A7U2F0C6_PHANO|nr:hypothetical protein HBH56_174050 [Parastagonospora nodorum]QRC96383.1 hypothetical protein JI435_408880 [Parastagonospora nodorum SN15]KAH3926425.1 hypothetical protein HBH54_169080 [Parastagonospora nodorum]KAH3955787.1 hypothetical protein HBH53_001910 [Parastagonospora nodorum]KAH3971185.1 hypothetical protein HBH51_111460 [Parastagonospora nodorum]